MPLICLETVRNPTVHSVPYQWYSFPDIISPEIKQLLFDDYPVENFIEHSRLLGEKKNYRFNILKISSDNKIQRENFNSLRNSWQEFLKELSSREYFETICEAFELNSKKHYVDVGLYRYQKGDWVTTHIDNEDKVISQLFYFNINWSSNWGGQLYLSAGHELADISKVIAPDELTSVAIKRTSDAWHGVYPVTPSAQQDRLGLQYEVWSRT